MHPSSHIITINIDQPVLLKMICKQSLTIFCRAARKNFTRWLIFYTVFQHDSKMLLDWKLTIISVSMNSLNMKMLCKYHLKLRKLKRAFIFRQYNLQLLFTIIFLRSARTKNMCLGQTKSKNLLDMLILELVQNFNNLCVPLLNKLTRTGVPAQFI
jgi:hypothetical protein